MIWTSRDLKFSEIMEEASKMNYWYFVLSAIFALAANYSRAVRWRYLIESFGHQLKTKNLFLSILMMYVSNLIIPRSGEVTRCGTVFKYEKIPVKKLFGTVVLERLFDVLSLLVLIVVLVLIQYDTVLKLYYGSALPNIVAGLLNNKWFLFWSFLSVFTIVFLLYVLRKKIAHIGFVEKIFLFLIEMREGLKKVFKMKNKLAFFVHTVFIWVMYFCATSVCFFAYEPSANLGFIAFFSSLIAGSLAMIAPTNGGIGAWHAMVILTLGIFGLSFKESAAIANVAFGINLISIVVSGVVAFIVLPYVNNDVKINKEHI